MCQVVYFQFPICEKFPDISNIEEERDNAKIEEFEGAHLANFSRARQDFSLVFLDCSVYNKP